MLEEMLGLFEYKKLVVEVLVGESGAGGEKQ